MPISRRQFDSGVDKETDKWMKEIHKFLSEHKDEAYSEDEIRVKFNLKPLKPSKPLKPPKHKLDWSAFIDDSDTYFGDSKTYFPVAIDTLVELGAIIKKSIQDINYYTYNKPLDG